MTLEEAKAILDQCERTELRDHYFGDREVIWRDKGKTQAEGYFGSDTIWVSIYLDGDTTNRIANFTGDDAYELVRCGHTYTIVRKGTEGPQVYMGA